jgi:TetR/AcrR family transcriptional regulator
MSKGEVTKNLILDYAKSEFLDRGFKDASVRNIAKTMGLTTGAIFRYYPDKEALFIAVVDDAAQSLYESYKKMQKQFQYLPLEKRNDIVQTNSPEYLLQMLDIIYENFDAFKLIICHSEGTRYVSYIDRLVSIAVENTQMFIDILKKDGVQVKETPSNLIHIIYSAFFTAVFEVVVHDMPKEEAVEYVSSMFEFFNSGWKTLLHI